jgi:hypothetical protein
VVNALESAGRTGYEPKRRLLGRVVINAALDAATIDHSQLIALALRDLEAPHVRALERIRIAVDTVELDPLLSPPAPLGEEEVRAELGRWQSEAAIEAGSRELEPVIAALIRTGVAISATVLDAGLSVNSVTKFGRELLDELRSVSGD